MLAAISSIASSAMSFVLAAVESSGGGGVSAPVLDLSGVDFSPLTATLTSVIPAVLPVVVTCCGFRKGISFMMSAIRGA